MFMIFGIPKHEEPKNNEMVLGVIVVIIHRVQGHWRRYVKCKNEVLSSMAMEDNKGIGKWGPV